MYYVVPLDTESDIWRYSKTSRGSGCRLREEESGRWPSVGRSGKREVAEDGRALQVEECLELPVIHAPARGHGGGG